MFGITDFIVSKLKPHLSLIFSNFDSDNFSFSVGGNVTLTDLHFRPNLIQDLGLDLPFAVTVLGSVGTICAEVGVGLWSGISLSVTIKDVHMVISSLRRLTYDQKKEFAFELERKRKELEELIKKTIKGEPKKDDEGPGFLEKTLISVAEGATVLIENVHIRFENEGQGGEEISQTFTAGLKLKKLNIATMDEIEEWSHGDSTSNSTFFKKGDLEGLSIYWNFVESKDQLYSLDYKAGGKKSEKEASVSAIVVKMKKYLKLDDKEMNYALKPIVATLRAMITRQPQKLEKPFSLPKIHADFKMNTISFEINDYEYEEVLAVMDYLELIKRGRKVLKYRPLEPITKGNTKKWWNMAYQAAVGHVARRRRNWSWDHIKAHRRLRDKYAEVYLRKLTEDEPSEELLKEVQEAEDGLDNFNVVLVQKETEEKNALRKDLIDKRKAEEKAKQSGWSSWFKSAPSVNITKEELDKYLAEKYTEADRKAAYDSIDIEKLTGGEGEVDDEGPIEYPKDYKGIMVGMVLKGLGGKLVKVKDEEKAISLLDIGLNTFDVAFETHPGLEGMKVHATMASMEITGCRGDEAAEATPPTPPPDIFKSILQKEQKSFLAFTFETNPATSKCDQKINFDSAQSQLIYHYHTAQKLLDFFTPPSTKIQHVGGASVWSGFQQVSTDGVLNLSKTSSTMEIDIKIVAPTVLIPEGGKLTGDANVLIANLGTLTIKSEPRVKDEEVLGALDTLQPQPTTTDGTGAGGEINPKVMACIFNHYEIKLTNIEVLLAMKGDDVPKILYDATTEPTTTTTFTRPTPILHSNEIIVNVWQCIITEDVRFPKLKAALSIPSIELDVIDLGMMKTLHLGLTMPLPKPRTTSVSSAAAEGRGRPDQNLVFDAADDPSANYASALQNVANVKMATTKAAEKAVQLTDLIISLNLDDINLKVSVQDPITSKLKPFLHYQLHRFEVGVQLKTFGMTVNASLDWMNAEYVGATVPGIIGPIYLLNTPPTAGTGDGKSRFIKAHLFSVTRSCPKELSGPIKQDIEVNISIIDIILHEESIQNIVNILFGCKEELDKIKPVENKVHVLGGGPPSSAAPPPAVVAGAGGKEKSTLDQFRRMTSKFKDNPNDVLLKACASLAKCSFKLTSARAQITEFDILGWTVQFEDKLKESKLTSQVDNFEILNLESGTQFPKILSVEGGAKLAAVDVIIYKDVKHLEATAPEFEVKLTAGGPKLILLGSYVKNVMKFVNKFQTAFAAISNKSKEAGGKAVEMGKQFLEQTDLKLHLDISLDSPIVILAKSDGSPEVLYYNFGRVTLKNKLVDGGRQGENAGEIVVIDDMSLSIGGMRLARAILDPITKTPTVESQLVKPLQLSISLQRNLSKSWYHKIPTFKVKAELPDANIIGSDEDAIFFTSAVLDLINNATAKEEEPPAAQLGGGPGARQSRMAGGMMLIRVKPPAPPAPTQLLDFEVVISKFGLTVFQGELTLAGKSGVLSYDPSQGFGGISLENLHSDGIIWTNNDITANLGLDEIQVQDLRPNVAESLKNSIVSDETSDDGSAADKKKQMIGLSVKIGKDPSTEVPIYTVGFDSRSFKWLFNMEFINAVAKFDLSLMDRIKRLMKKDEPEGGGPPAAAGVQYDHKIGTVASHSSPTTTGGAPSAAASSSSSGIPLINADINMKEITVVVLKDPSVVTTANAVLITYSGTVKLATQSGISSGTVQLTLSAYTSNFKMSEPPKKLGEILKPTNLSLNITLQPRGAQTIVEATISDIAVHFSAGTLNLIYKVISDFSATISGAKQDEKVADAAAGDVDYSNIWESRPLKKSDFWFLKSDTSDDDVLPVRAGRLLGDQLITKAAAPPPPASPIEKVTLKTGKLFVTVESGSGAMTTPLLFLDASLSAELSDWSSQLKAKGVLQLSAGYNNPHVGSMEYLIEPLVQRNSPTDQASIVPWDVKFDVQKASPDSGLVINVAADKPLELMVSKTSIEVIKSAVAALSAAYSSTAPDKTLKSSLDSAPYVFKNVCGAQVWLDVSESSLVYYLDGVLDDGKYIEINDGESILLGNKSESIGIDNESVETIVKVTIFDYCVKNEPLKINQAVSRFFPLPTLTSKQHGSVEYGLVADIEVANDYSTHVTIHSMVQIINELHLAVEVYSYNIQRQTKLVTTLQPQHTWSLPFNVVYEPNILGIMCKPLGYAFGSFVYDWKTLRGTTGSATEVSCSKEKPDAGPDICNYNIVGAAHDAVNRNSDQPLAGKNFTLRLKPPLAVRNLLPMQLTIIVTTRTGKQEGQRLPSGSEQPVTNIATSQPGGGGRGQAAAGYGFALMVEFQGQTWTSTFTVDDNSTNNAKGTAAFYNNKTRQAFYLNFEKTIVSKTIKFAVYCPYWIVNYTKMDLSYQSPSGGMITFHPALPSVPTIYATDTPITEDSKTSMAIQVGQGEWALPISIDHIGLPTGLICHTRRPYELSINIEIASNNLTKIVTITPRFTITNACSFPIKIFELNATAPPVSIPKLESIPYWPKTTQTKNVLVKFSVDDDTVGDYTDLCSIDKATRQFLRLENRHGGLCFSVNAQDTKIGISLSEFSEPEIPLVFVNNIKDVQFQVAELEAPDQSKVLLPKSALLYAWLHPATTTENRFINWSPEHETLPTLTDINVETAEGKVSGTFQAQNSSGETKEYSWHTFTTGFRKVMLFTHVNSGFEELFKKKTTADKSAKMELKLSLRGVGLSLVNNIEFKDVLYARITALANSPSPAIGLNFKSYRLGFEVDATIGTLRIDNQAGDATYPVVINQKAASTTKPPQAPPSQFIHVHLKKMSPTTTSVLSTLTGDTGITEFDIGGDMGMVANLLEMIQPAEARETKFVDLSVSSRDYRTEVPTSEEFYGGQLKTTESGSSILVFEDFTFPSASFNLSFAMTGADKIQDGLTPISIVNYVIKRFGETKFGIKDAHFDVDGIHNLRLISTQPEITDILMTHYKDQITKDMFSKIFNLDIPGNPFSIASKVGSGIMGLGSSVTQGLKDGNIVGGAVGGVSSLVGKTLGGVGGTVGGILGGVGMLTDTLHIPLLGGLFGGLGSGFTKTGQAVSGVLDQSSAVPTVEKMRPPRDVRQGVPIKPFVAGSPILSLLQRTPQYQGAGAYLSEMSLSGNQILLFTQNKLFHLILATPTTFSTNNAFNWSSIQTVTTDRGTSLILNYQGADRYGRVVPSQYPIRTSGQGELQALSTTIGGILKVVKPR